MGIFRYKIQKIAEMLNAFQIIQQEQYYISHLCVDTRALVLPEQTLFVALTGRRNGHEFIEDAYAMGVRNFLVQNDFRISHLWLEANFLKVPNTLDALQLLVQKHRESFHIPVIGITGSNGKTIVKEWIWQLLNVDYLIVKSPKSYNSQIGVPLSVWQMATRHELGIFEAGISKIDEMQRLQSMIQPTIGIITNIGEAHAGGFISKEAKLTQKLVLIKDAETVIFSPDYVPLDKIKNPHIFTWSFSQKADLQVLNVQFETEGSRLEILYLSQIIRVDIPFSDRASLENVLSCWSLLLVLGYSNEIILHRIKLLHHVSMRLELKTGIHQCSIIDDSYSADESSLEIALDFLGQQNQHPTRTLILSDITQSAKSDADLYQSIAQLVSRKKIDKFIAIGEHIQQFQSYFEGIQTRYFFKSTLEFINHFNEISFFNESILVKGSRVFAFEKISKMLSQKVHDTVLEVNLNALIHNLNVYKSKISSQVKLMVMVKAFSYGSGTFEIANVLQYHKVDYLAVAYADEGLALRKAGINLPIMVMSPETMAFENMIASKLEPEIYSHLVLDHFIESIPDRLEAYPIHLKLDTGMRRLGFVAMDIPLLIEKLKKTKKIKVISIFSHLAVSDDAQFDTITHSQIQNFQRLASQIEMALGYETIKHIANTATINRFPEAHLDMVRLGIGMYGFDSATSGQNLELQTVVSLKTTITQIKRIDIQDRIGYGRIGLLPKGGKIATVKIGYADGYHRAFGNGVGAMLVNGKLAYTVGNICMDMCMIDVTGIETFEGDEAIVFDEILSINELAKRIHTIPYEILTNVSQRVKRVYFYD